MRLRHLVINSWSVLLVFSCWLGGSTCILPASASAKPELSNGSIPFKDLPAAAIKEKGRHLFAQNCAHCHGEDARGDEGPSLYDLTKSDARISRIIKEGIKGEMPRFGTKLTDQDIQALIAFLRTLKEES